MELQGYIPGGWEFGDSQAAPPLKVQSDKQGSLLMSCIPRTYALVGGSSTKAEPSKAAAHYSKNPRQWPHERFTILSFSTFLGAMSGPPPSRERIHCILVACC